MSRSAVRPWDQFATAATFLTRLPVPARPAKDADEHAARLHASVGWFPLVGAVVGAACAGTFWLAGQVFPPLVAAVLAAAVGALVTGAFHEDGLADTVDGLWGGWSQERRLEIMRDSRIGTYGTLAVVLSSLLLVTTLASLPMAYAGRGLVVAHLVSRFVVLPVLALVPPARDDGHGASVARPPTAASWLVAALTVVVVGAGLLGWWSAVVLVAALLTAAGVSVVARRKVGGVTGDVLGAANHLAMLVGLLVVLALVGQGAPGPFG